MIPSAKTFLHIPLETLLKNLVGSFRKTINYNGKLGSDEILINQYMKSATEAIPQVWRKKQDFIMLKTAFNRILSEIHKLPSADPDEIDTKKTAFQNAFESAANSIIDNYQQQLKKFFLSDVYSVVLNEINKEMLIRRVESIHSFHGDKVLEVLYDKIKNEHKVPLEKHPSKTPFRKTQWTCEQIKVLNNIYCKVAKDLNIPILRLLQYIINKKKRNREVHIAESLIKFYRKNHLSQGDQHIQFSQFSNIILPIFTDEEIKDTQNVFFKYNEYSKLIWEEK